MGLQTFQDYSSLIGVSYSDRDCWGIVVSFYRLHGVALPMFYDLETRPCAYSTQDLIDKSKRHFKEISHLEYGSIVLIRLHGVPTHVGVYVGDGMILHTTEATGCILEPLRKWQRHIEGIYDCV